MDRFRSIVAPNFQDYLCNISLRSCLFFNICINKGGGKTPSQNPPTLSSRAPQYRNYFPPLSLSNVR